jgi:hypothetical protein
MPTLTIEINPRPQFLPYLKRKERWACLVVHRRGGKTFACCQDLGARAMTNKRAGAPPRYAYVAPTRDQAKDIAWPYFEQFFSPLPGVEFSLSELKVTLPNKASIRLYSGDNYERMRGIYLDGVILDEFADIDPAAWSTVIRPCLADHQGWATFIGTAKGRNEFFRVHELAKADPRWFSMLLKASESGLINAEEMREILLDTPRDKYLQEYECDFSVAAPGAIFVEDLEQARKEGRVNPDVMHYEGFPVYTTFDIGAPINTKCWIWQIIGDRIKFLHCLTGTQEISTPARWAKLLIEEFAEKRRYKFGCHFLPHDGESYWLPAMHEAGVSNTECLIKPTSEWDTINEARRMFSRFQFNADECSQGIMALESWCSREKDKGATIDNKPEHNWASHWGTAFAYAAWAIKQGRATNRAAMPERAKSSKDIPILTGVRGETVERRGNTIRRRPTIRR